MAFPIYTSPQKSQLSAASLLTFFPTVAVAIRFYARRINKSALTATDWTMLAALICCWVLNAEAIAGVTHGGIGLHIGEVPLPNLKTMTAILYAFQLQYAAAEGLVKTSMCLLYMEIFRVQSFKKWAYITIVVCNCFAVFVILLTTLICMPVSMNVDPTIKGKCGNRTASWIVIGVLNIVTDFMVLLLPMPWVWGLQIPMKKKIALVVIFSLGAFVCVVSMIRLHFLLQIDVLGDITYTISQGFVWSIMEPTLAVTIGCFPTYGPLFQRHLRSQSRSSKPLGGSSNISDGPMDSRNRKFHRINGDNMEIPLTQHSTKATAEVKPAHDHYNDRQYSDPESGRINVVKEWEVKRF